MRDYRQNMRSLVSFRFLSIAVDVIFYWSRISCVLSCPDCTCVRLSMTIPDDVCMLVTMDGSICHTSLSRWTLLDVRSRTESPSTPCLIDNLSPQFVSFSKFHQSHGIFCGRFGFGTGGADIILRRDRPSARGRQGRSPFLDVRSQPKPLKSPCRLEAVFFEPGEAKNSFPVR